MDWLHQRQQGIHKLQTMLCYVMLSQLVQTYVSGDVLPIIQKIEILIAKAITPVSDTNT